MTVQSYNYKWYTRMMRWYRFSPISFGLLNPLIISALKTKYLINAVKVKHYWRIHQHEGEKWFAETPLFFGFALSRSGTSFLGNLLKHEALNSCVEHESNIFDFIFFEKAIYSQEHALKYIQNYRKYEIFYRLKGWNVGTYGEISPHLRQHCVALQNVFPEANFFHLVRNGRDVVSSLVARGRLSNKDPILYRLKPPYDDPFRGNWEAMNHFEKVCWLWQRDNRLLRERINNTIKFENIIENYDYFNERLLLPNGLSISKRIWHKYVGSPVNPTPNSRKSKSHDWTQDMYRSFDRICGEEMAACGYQG